MKAAFYECDVTPPLGGLFVGKASPTPAMDVLDRLYVKAVVFEEDGELAAMVSMDCCMVHKDLPDFVAKRVFEYTGIPAEKITLTATHTHTGAPISSQELDTTCDDDAYQVVFFRLVADSVILAYKRLGEATAKIGTSIVDDVSFVRNYEVADGKYITHGRGRDDIVRPIGKIDPTVSVLMVEREGTPIGAIVNFASHQDSVGRGGYSGDYSSIISKELKKVYGPDFVSLFLIGPCGNINHVNPDASVKCHSYTEIGKKLAVGALSAIADAKPVGYGVKMIKNTVRLTRRKLDNEALKAESMRLLSYLPNAFRVQRMLNYNSSVTSDTAEVNVSGVKIGNTCIYLLPGEIFSSYTFDLKERSPFDNNIVVENTDQSIMYIPSEEVFVENSYMYETTLGTNCYEKGAGRKLVEGALEIGALLSVD